MDIITITENEVGCFLDNHRGHYIQRDLIQMACNFGFIIDPFAQFAIDMYEDHDGDQEFPFESLVELADHATDWLNSGQSKCLTCEGKGQIIIVDTDDGPMEYPVPAFPDETPVICKDCSGSGRGPRISGQNFPPLIPEGYSWGWNDGDYGIYPYVLFNIGAENWSGHSHLADELTMPQARTLLNQHNAREDVIERLLGQSPEDMALQAGGFIVTAIDPQ